MAEVEAVKGVVGYETEEGKEEWARSQRAFYGLLRHDKNVAFHIGRHGKPDSATRANV